MSERNFIHENFHTKRGERVADRALEALVRLFQMWRPERQNEMNHL